MSRLPSLRRLHGQGALFALLLLALVLLWSQSLGLLHGIVHGQSQASGAGALAWQVGANVVTPGPGADSFFSRPFSGHDGAADCRLYDQSSHFDAMPGVPMLALARVLLPVVYCVCLGLVLARWHALFQARGPPLVR